MNGYVMMFTLLLQCANKFPDEIKFYSTCPEISVLSLSACTVDLKKIWFGKQNQNREGTRIAF